MTRRDIIILEIKAERATQDAQWGGPDHDDEHGPDEFVTFIEHQIARSDRGRGPDARERLVKIAALAVAAVESYDRKMLEYGAEG